MNRKIRLILPTSIQKKLNSREWYYIGRRFEKEMQESRENIREERDVLDSNNEKEV